MNIPLHYVPNLVYIGSDLDVARMYMYSLIYGVIAIDIEI